MATTASSDQMPQMARLSLRHDDAPFLRAGTDELTMAPTRRSDTDLQHASPLHAGATSTSTPTSHSASSSPLLHPQAAHPSAEPHVPRPRSPYTRSHLRSRSAVNATAPPIARAHSAPALEPTLRAARSPAHSPVRSASPMRTPPPSSRLSARKSADELFPGTSSYSGLGMTTVPAIESIAEDAELFLGPAPPSTPTVSTTVALNSSHSHMIPRTPSSSSLTRRPSSSPLQHSQGGSSPSFGATRFNEHFPSATTHSSTHTTTTASASAGSSIVSTPTSFRSRSPSISSLETIPDSPDAERAAIEADDAARLKAAAERASAIIHHDSDADVDARRGRLSALSWGGKEKRKRWSVCGAERRGDFEMETIWED